MKIKTERGYRFIKEFGGAIKRNTVSKTAKILAEKKLIVGRVLDFGCGHGYDADYFGWSAYDPHYRQTKPRGSFDTILCNHVANVLTRKSRLGLYTEINDLLSDGGIAYISVPRNIPKRGKAGPRKRIQNYVVLTLPVVYADSETEIYAMKKDTEFDDKTIEFEEI